MGISSAATLRSSIARVHRRQVRAQGRRYGDDLRRQVVAHATAERSRGVSVRTTAACLNLSYPTLLQWMQGQVQYSQSTGRPLEQGFPSGVKRQFEYYTSTLGAWV